MDERPPIRHKTAGQIAYERYCEDEPYRDARQQLRQVPWDELPHWIKANWEHRRRR